ncbi:MAG: transglutaminase-like domain-containing protein [Pyrinomonadaceae bacterium]|nr:transglutaminase-like domain-containing protein [Pyrinomonadaceae bacterium]
MNEYLEPTEFLDFDKQIVLDFAEKNTVGAKTETEKAVKLYYAVRDGFQYNPYLLDLRREGLTASNLLTRNRGYCVEKAVLLAACVRAVGVPSRLSFYIVRNHIATEKLEKKLQKNYLVFHGAAEIFLNDKWLKTTPAFNASLCKYLGVDPLEFDGTKDSIFQEYDHKGNVFMTYLHEYGAFSDLPYELYLQELKKHYPHIFEEGNLIYDFTK